ncbi:hypothetical protein CWB41_15875 [Methylovirgula ligni]|uniref:Phage integrase family protein n=1 Tax=Methylovirgula ligni TaxID=569860 RepID=A0A3D9Z1N6_9HYPH|nr:site-specific integrase [Methylovirgula ligni]QAY97031.1 hypothetical protein CWB41_15875 [Methylovirgula ligni]REF87900.1 phage integrase family protein [Methylovirgula ligni]
MSIYKREGSPNYTYDFQFKGQRFAGSTGHANKRDAEAREREIREELKRQFANARSFDAAPMTIDEAAGRYWAEVGERAKSHRDINWSLVYIVKNLGPDKAIASITDSDVAALVARRRGDLVSYPKMIAGKMAKERIPKRISNSTVNRSVIDPLRRVLRRAEQNWGETVGRINWRVHRLREPVERVRFASAEEEAAIFAVLPSHYHPAVRFAILSGLRASELCGMKWTDINWSGLIITVRGKGNKTAPIPLSAAMIEILAPMRPRDAVGTPVWRNMSNEPMTYRSLSAAFVKACEQAGVVGLRLHDLRHTCATRLLRSTGNLKMVSRLLRHSDVSTTAKYAHVLDDDLRNAMNAMEPVKVPS